MSARLSGVTVSANELDPGCSFTGIVQQADHTVTRSLEDGLVEEKGTLKISALLLGTSLALAPSISLEADGQQSSGLWKGSIPIFSFFAILVLEDGCHYCQPALHYCG